MDNREERLKQVAHIAVALEAQTGCPAPLLVTQWAVESQWGAKPAGNAGYFGIKQAARHTKFCLVTTREWFTQLQIADWNRRHPDRPARPTGKTNGPKQEVMIDDTFADYGSLEDSCRDYAWLVTQGSPYKEVWEKYQQTKDLDALIAGVAHTYATSPSYAAMAKTIAHQSNVGGAIAQARQEVTSYATA